MKSFITIFAVLFFINTMTAETNKVFGEENYSSLESKGYESYKLAMHTNILHWMAATPNIGIEWRPISRLSIILDVEYAPWYWNNKLNYFRIRNFQPQVRLYMLKGYKFYIGAQIHAGQLNWKVKTKGTQGNFIGTGIVVGYQLRINRSIDIDFNIGPTYTSYKFDKYKDVEGFLYPYEKGLKKNYWGIPSAAVSLIWKIGK